MFVEILSNAIIIIGVVFMFFGVFGLFRLQDFYLRVLVTAKIDTVGAITLIVGLIIRHGISFFSLKLLLLVVLILVLNPLIAHIIARSAYSSAGGLHDEYDDAKGGR